MLCSKPALFNLADEILSSLLTLHSIILQRIFRAKPMRKLVHWAQTEESPADRQREPAIPAIIFTALQHTVNTLDFTADL